MAEVARARMVANGVAPEDIEVRIGNGIVSVVGGRRLGLAEVPLASMPDESILELLRSLARGLPDAEPLIDEAQVRLRERTEPEFSDWLVTQLTAVTPEALGGRAG